MRAGPELQSGATVNQSRQPGIYLDGRLYSGAQGRFAPKATIEDRLSMRLAVVDLDTVRPTAAEFLSCMLRELKIRFYLQNSRNNYRSNLQSFLRWFGGPPHAVTREHVRCYLEYLVDAGLDSSTISNHLSAIRTTFDKMCFREVTLGLATPRKPKRKPPVLSVQEIQRLLEATPSIRDKLCLGLMYATGMRVSEVVRLRYRDFDFDRGVITVWQGKGRADRVVTLPNSFRNLLVELEAQNDTQGFLFPGETKGKHISSRTAQRIMQRAVSVAGIQKAATPHILRHSFATHSFENGCDIRRIQRVLGHVNLETTTIYVHVARPKDGLLPSPLDTQQSNSSSRSSPNASSTTRRSGEPPKPVGRLRLYFKPEYRADGNLEYCRVTLAIQKNGRPIYLVGTIAKMERPGFVTISIPPEERWHKQLQQLTFPQRQRLSQPEFFHLLQSEVAGRYLRLQHQRE